MSYTTNYVYTDISTTLKQGAQSDAHEYYTCLVASLLEKSQKLLERYQSMHTTTHSVHLSDHNTHCSEQKNRDILQAITTDTCKAKTIIINKRKS